MNLSQLLLKPPTPALVSKEGAKRLSRWALLLIAGAYVLAGYVGRAPWKSADIISTALMQGMARGELAWWHPALFDHSEALGALLPYWLGAWSLQWLGAVVGTDLAVRLPFMLMLAASLALTWFGTYYLALTTSAQPLAFAFGGEASPKAYARAVADGGVLAMMASLGLAQLGHEVGPPVAQLFFVSMLFAATSALRFYTLAPMVGMAVATVGLHLSGAPTVATLLCLASAIALWRTTPADLAVGRKAGLTLQWKALAMLGFAAAGVGLALLLGSFALKLVTPKLEWAEWQRLGRLGLWFLWPLWPLVLFTLWQWRRHLTNPHLLWPMCLLGITLGQVLFTQAADISLLVGLPAFAALAAFSLPTLSRAVSALIDWFTLLFFTLCGLVVWVMWVAMLTGWPAQPAANVKRLVPGFTLEFSWLPFIAAVVATLAWLALVRWRTSRHRSAIWKSLVLPAGGAVWAWVLLTTLWLPVFDYARSYGPLLTKVEAHIPVGVCVVPNGVSNSQWAALKLHGAWPLVGLKSDKAQDCTWMVSTSRSIIFWPTGWEKEWVQVQTLARPADDNEDLVILKRQHP